MAQSLNKTVLLSTTGTSYLSIAGKVGKFLFASKDSGAILKIAREKLGNDKVVKLPTLIQTIGQKFKNLFAKK